MPVEKPDVIDMIVQMPDSKEVSLIMVEARDWNQVPEAVDQLGIKFRTYFDYLMSGALTQQHPQYAGVPVRIELYHFVPIPASVATVLRQWAGRLAEIPVSIYSQRMYWNPILAFAKKLMAKISGPQHGALRWQPEPGSGEPLLTPTRFAQEFATFMRKKRPDFQIQIVKDLELKITTGTGKEFSGYLGNAYDRYHANPAAKEEVFQRYGETLLATPVETEQPIQRDKIVPVIKDKGWVEKIEKDFRALGNNEPLNQAYEPYNDELAIVYAVDTPTSLRFLSISDLKTLELDLDELRPLACANLERLLPAPDIQLEAGIYRIRAGGDYDASLLLLESLWASRNIPVTGEIVAAIPARDCLVVTGSEDEDGIDKTRRLAQAVAAQAPYRLTPSLFVYRQGRFVPFES